MVFRDVLQELLRLPGAHFCCIADGTMGKVLASAGAEVDDGPGVPLAVLGWGATAAGYLAAAASDELDDLIVTSRRAYHLVRQLDGRSGQLLLVYLRLDRARANLAVARRALAAVRVGPAPVPHPREAARRQETPVQSASPGGASGAAPGAASAGGRAAAVALVAPGERRQAERRQPLPRRHQVAALPLPRRSAPTPRAGPASAPPPRPLPRRTAEAPPPAVPRAGPPAVPEAHWADDIGTMRRLLSALRKLR